MENLYKDFTVSLSDKQKLSFENYYNLLIETNQKFNITAITEKQEVYTKHFADSLCLLPVLNDLCGGDINNKKLIDVGTGGGFPSVPVKITSDGLISTMLEANNKKCTFLEEVINTLNLSNAFVINGRAEEVLSNGKLRENFDFATARAVARLNVLCEYCLPFVKVDGYFIALKGDSTEEVNEAQNAIKVLGGKIEKILDYSLDGAKRSIIIIKKIKNTDKIYPRSNAKIKKKPL